MGKLGRAPSESKQSRGRASRSRGAEPAQGSRETGLSASWPWASRRETRSFNSQVHIKEERTRAGTHSSKSSLGFSPCSPTKARHSPRTGPPAPGSRSGSRVQRVAEGCWLRGLICARGWLWPGVWAVHTAPAHGPSHQMQASIPSPRVWPAPTPGKEGTSCPNSTWPGGAQGEQCP